MLALLILAYISQLTMVFMLFAADIMIGFTNNAFPTKKSLILNLIPFYFMVAVINHIRKMD